MNRLLGASEHLLWSLAQSKPINVVLCATITGQLSIEQLNTALTWVQHRHPLLAVKIALNNDEHPQFISEGVPSIPLRVIDRQGEEHWCQEVEAELLRPFSHQGPLIRVACLQSLDVSELIVTFDHCIGDGLSGAYLIRDILHAASQPGSIQQHLPEPPACEELIPLSALVHTRDAFDRDFESHKTAKFNNLNFEALKSHTSDKEIQGKEQLRLLHWDLSSEQTAKLVSYCRQEQTTVHGALCASFLLSVAQEASADEAVLRCMSPLSLRNYLLPPIGEDFGAYYTRELTYHQIKPESDFWQVAREAKHQLNQVLADGIFVSVQKVSAFLSTKPDPVRLRQYVNDLIGSELTVTNLGRLNIPEQFGSLQLRQLHLTVAGIAPIIVGAVTLAGKLFVSFRCLKTVIPQACAEKISQRAMQRLCEAIA
jgi:NRPS condensation-like uncharacterized protein